MPPLSGGTLGVGSGCTVRTWDHALGEETMLLREHKQGAVTSVCLSRDGKRVFSGDRKGAIRAVDVATGLSAGPVLVPGSHVLSLTVSRGGERLYSGGLDGSVREWVVATGECRRVLRGHQGEVLEVCADGEDVFSCGDDGTIRAWERQPSSGCKAVLLGHTGGVLCMSALAQEKLVSGGKDGTVREWLRGVCKRVLRGHTGPVLSVCASEGDFGGGGGPLLFSGGQDGTIRVWEGSLAKRVLQGHAGGVRSLCVSLSGDILFSGGLDGTVREWDVLTAKGKHLLSGIGCVSAISFAALGIWARVRTRGHTETERVPVDTLVPSIVGRQAELERFLSPEAGDTERRLKNERARQRQRLESFIAGLHSLVNSATSDSLQSAALDLAQSLFVREKEGDELVDIGDLATAVRAGGVHAGLINEALPVVSARQVCDVLIGHVTPLLETLERHLQTEAQELAWQQSAMLSARKAERTLLEQNKSVLAAGEIVAALLESTRGLQGSFALPGKLEATACVAAAKVARDAVDGPLARSRECQNAARRRHELARQELLRAEERGALFKDDTFPKIDDEGQREVEREACSELVRQLRHAVEWTSSESARMDALVLSMEEAARRWGGLLEDAQVGLRDGAVLEEGASELLREREGVDSQARVALDEGRQKRDKIYCVVVKSQENVEEASLATAAATEALARAKEGNAWLQQLAADVVEREKGMCARQLAGNLGGLFEDDVRTAMVSSGLGTAWDKVRGKKVTVQMIAARLPSAGSERTFAVSLEEFLEVAVELHDACERKRIVHRLQLLQFGLSCKDHCEGGGGGHPCTWDEARVRKELAERGVELEVGQLVWVNGEVLLLLKDCFQHVKMLGIIDTDLQQRLMGQIDSICLQDPLGRLRSGIDAPPRRGEVEGGPDSAECSAHIEAVLRGERTDPCLVPFKLASEWAGGFSEEHHIGRGGFATVFGGYVGGRAVAVKLLENGADKHLKREINMLSRFRHPNIIRLLGYTGTSSDDGQACLIFDMGSKGSLGDNLREDTKAAGLTWKHRVRIYSGVCVAVNWLHCHDKIEGPAFHRDIKSDNIVLTACVTPKFIDCGLAQFQADKMPAGTVHSTKGIAFGTPGYMCQKYERTRVFDAKAEVFALGVVLLEILTGNVHGEKTDIYGTYIEDEEEISPDPRAGDWDVQCIKGCVDLAKRCCAKHGGRLPSVAKVLHEIRMLEEAHCKMSAEEIAAIRQVAKLQDENDAGRAAGAAMQILRKEIRDKADVLAVLREANIKAAQDRAEQAKRHAARMLELDRQRQAEDEKRELQSQEEKKQREHQIREEAAKREAELLERMEDCLLCFETFDRAELLHCASAHGICGECISSAVGVQISDQEWGTFVRQETKIHCESCKALKTQTFYNQKEMIAFLDNETFAQLLQRREEASIVAAVQEKEAVLQRKIDELEEQLNKAQDSLSAAVKFHKKHVFENILIEKCPRATCRAPFDFHDGCFALTCARCRCGFCAYCLKDCGADAHAHVAVCAYNRQPDRNPFAPKHEYHRAQRMRRLEQLRAYFAQVEADHRKPLLEELRTDLNDIGIDPDSIRV